MATQDEITKLEKAFKNLDTNHDGRLSKNELLGGYSKIMPGALAEAEV